MDNAIQGLIKNAFGYLEAALVPDHWTGVAARGRLEAMLFVVHGLEQGGPKWKAQLRSDLWQMGDPYSAQDCDYDWADEAGHIHYGQDWIHALFPGMPESEVIARTEREVNLWKGWIAQKHASGQHGYDLFLPRIEAKCRNMPAVARPEHFKPLGSSAATTSYASSG